ncbi:MAG: DUF1853 family protein [Cycloclasticus sp.]
MNSGPALHDSVVRDLAWVIASPPLIQGHIDICNWTDSAYWQNERCHFQPHLLDVDTKPTGLHQFLYQQRDQRLGHRFETLLSYWFNNNDRYQIIAQNLQIQDAERTIGEFDFIVYDTVNNTHQHWEVACKFYLGLGDTREINNWHGPMLQDRLAVKYEQMQTRQSQLSILPASFASLEKLNIQIDQHICLMKGRLFYPISQEIRHSPTLISAEHQQGWWARPEEFIQYFKRHNLRWYLLNKNQWLAELYFKPDDPSYSTDQLLELFLSEPSNRPICIAAFNPEQASKKEITRGFLVAKDWASELIIDDNTG